MDFRCTSDMDVERELARLARALMADLQRVMDGVSPARRALAVSARRVPRCRRELLMGEHEDFGEPVLVELGRGCEVNTGLVRRAGGGAR